MLSTILGRLAGDETRAEAGGSKKKERGGPRHIKLLKRATEPSLEERLAKVGRQLTAVATAGAGEAGGRDMGE
jgi:hypothetical protein